MYRTLALFPKRQEEGEPAGSGKRKEKRVTPDRAGQYPEEDGAVERTALEGGREGDWKLTWESRKLDEAA